MAFNSYVSEPMSTEDIRYIVKQFRKILGIENEEYIQVAKYLDVLSLFDPLYDYHIVDDSELPDTVQGDMDAVNHIIRIKESVYEGACNGDPVDRMSISHEIGHYVLMCLVGIKFALNTNKMGYVVTYKDPEWQATVFASEFLMPAEMIKDMSPLKISMRFGVSINAAKTQLKHIK